MIQSALVRSCDRKGAHMLRRGVAGVLLAASVGAWWGTTAGVSAAPDARMGNIMTGPTLSALLPVNLVYADATGSFLVLLAIAQQQGFFEKHGLQIHSVAARGATVPRLTKDAPVGFIGEPAAILQASEGSDVRI